MNTSFEINNNPTLDNWNIKDSTVNQFIYFSNDVPEKSGNWSLLIKVDTLNRHSLEYPIVLNNYFSDDKFILSYWIKCVGESESIVILELYSSKNIYASLSMFRNTNNKWVYFCDTLTDYYNQSTIIDSAKFNIGVEKKIPYYPPLHFDSSYCLIDNIKVEQVSKQ